MLGLHDVRILVGQFADKQKLDCACWVIQLGSKGQNFVAQGYQVSHLGDRLVGSDLVHNRSAKVGSIWRIWRVKIKLCGPSPSVLPIFECDLEAERQSFCLQLWLRHLIVEAVGDDLRGQARIFDSDREGHRIAANFQRSHIDARGQGQVILTQVDLLNWVHRDGASLVHDRSCYRARRSFDQGQLVKDCVAIKILCRLSDRSCVHFVQGNGIIGDTWVRNGTIKTLVRVVDLKCVYGGGRSVRVQRSAPKLHRQSRACLLFVVRLDEDRRHWRRVGQTETGRHCLATLLLEFAGDGTQGVRVGENASFRDQICHTAYGVVNSDDVRVEGDGVKFAGADYVNLEFDVEVLGRICVV